MPTARDKLLELSELSGVSARLHFDSLSTSSSSVLQIYDQLEVMLMPDYEIELDKGLELSVDNDLVIELEPELTIEVD